MWGRETKNCSCEQGKPHFQRFPDPVLGFPMSFEGLTKEAMFNAKMLFFVQPFWCIEVSGQLVVSNI
jgi:hypothetical protein